jgi:hypothetical protein
MQLPDVRVESAFIGSASRYEHSVHGIENRLERVVGECAAGSLQRDPR